MTKRHNMDVIYDKALTMDAELKILDAIEVANMAYDRLLDIVDERYSIEMCQELFELQGTLLQFKSQAEQHLKRLTDY